MGIHGKWLTVACSTLFTVAGGISARAVERTELRIGVYDVRQAGGQGADVRSIVRALNRAGWSAEAFTSLHLVMLLQYDVVYLSDMHKAGPSPEDWRDNIHAYLGAGGSVLQTWHHHILGGVSTGVQRVYGERDMVVKSGHSAVAGIENFKAVYKDHIIEHVGKDGTVLIENKTGQPVAAAGMIGKGRVVSTGLSLNIPSVNPVEMKLMDAFLTWLSSGAERSERMSVLREPQLLVSPRSGLVPAGMSMPFRIILGPVKGADACRASVAGMTVTLVPTGPGSLVYQGDVELAVPAGRETESVHQVVASLAGQTLTEEVTVKGVFAPAPTGEKRGVWLHVGNDRHPSVVMPELKKLGINMAVLRIAGGTAAFYASKVQPDVQDPLAEQGGDWLAEAVKYAHANGVEIHPYVNNCIVEGRTSEESLRRLEEQGRLQKNPDGQTIDWFCPSQPENVEAMTRPMVEIASNYDIDGIQYDFIRYPSSQGCFCEKCRALFEKETGTPVANWPSDVLEDGARYEEYIEFRCERISQLVKHISTEIRRVNDKAKISAAVFREWPSCREKNGQDWVRWCREGWLDFVCPMTYTQDSSAYEKLVNVHREAVPDGFPIVEGIGIASGSGTMDAPGKMALHIILARKASAAGFCGFCYRPEHTTTLFTPLTDWFDQERP